MFGRIVIDNFRPMGGSDALPPSKILIGKDFNGSVLKIVGKHEQMKFPPIYLF